MPAACDGDAAGQDQPQLLRSCATGLAVVAALSVLLHSNAASAADTDLSQQHHAVNAVFGELTTALRCGTLCNNILQP